MVPLMAVLFLEFVRQLVGLRPGDFFAKCMGTFNLYPGHVNDSSLQRLIEPLVYPAMRQKVSVAIYLTFSLAKTKQALGIIMSRILFW